MSLSPSSSSRSRASRPASRGEQFAACDLAAIARESVAGLAPAAHTRGVALALDAPAPVLVRGDAALLARADPQPRRQRRPLWRIGRVGAGLGWSAGAAAALRVEEQGPGIPRDERARAFDRFHRGAGSGESGAGLGLAIAARVAALHRAGVSFGAGPGGKGLRVTVAFEPVAPNARSET